MKEIAATNVRTGIGSGLVVGKVGIPWFPSRSKPQSLQVRPHHVLWKGRGKVHAIRPARMPYETEYAGQTWCSLYGSFAKTFVATDETLTCKTCAKREAERV